MSSITSSWIFKQYIYIYIYIYICGTRDLEIHYHKVLYFNLVGYSNSDWVE